MKKLLLSFLALVFFTTIQAQSHLKYLDYVFPHDSLSGFNEKRADSTILAHYYFGIEYKVMMYKLKRDFVNTKYGFFNPYSVQTVKNTPPVIAGAPCMNEDFEASPSTTSTNTVGTVGTTLAGWTVSWGQNTGINGSCLQTGCCPSAGSTDAWVRSTPWTAPAPLGVIAASPFGGTKVLQMNDNLTWQGEVVRIQQTFPVTASNALFQFCYRAAMDGSGHPCCDQPYMRVELMDCMNNILNCPKVDVIPPGPSCATVATTGWATSGSIAYTPNWIIKSIDLSPYLGTCVTIKVTVGDCDGWAHYGYAFFDSQCLPMTVGVNNLVFPAGTPLVAVAACGVATASLQAPAGMGPYLWNGPAGSGVTSNTNQAVNTTVAGNYTLTMNPPGICAPITKTLSLTFSSYPTGGFTKSNTCTTYTITNTGAAAPAVQTYSFAGPGAPSSFTTTSGTSVVNFAPNSTYTITQTITNAAGCYTTTSQTITTPNGPSPAFTAAPSFTRCLTGNTFTFSATTSAGTHTYNFSPSAGAPPTGNTANYGSVSFTSPGTYTVTHTVNNAGCTTAASSVVVVNSTPTISIASGTAPPCAGGTATLNATGGPGGLTWTGPNSYTAVASSTTTINNFQTTAQGIYTLTANNNGCTVTRTINLTMPNQPTVALTNTGPYCVGASIVLNAITNNTVISWTQMWAPGWWWSTCCSAFSGTVSLPATTSSSGLYFFSISWANGCYAKVTTSVTVNPCVLPIELTNFNAHCVGKNSVEIDWETATEKDCDHYIVKRSVDGLNYITVGTIQAHGTSFKHNTYKLIDEVVEPDRNYYYRLVEVEKDKSERDVDKVVYTSCLPAYKDISVYPVPANQELEIISKSDMSDATVTITDALGQIVKQINHVTLTKNTVFKVNATDLMNGSYLLNINSGDKTVQRKITVFR